MNNRHAAIYVRVSTEEQNTGMQEAELIDFAKRRGWSYSLYRDQGQCGAKASRPGLDELREDIQHGKADVVLVWTLDRLARSLRQLLTLSEELAQLGVDLIAYRQNLDTSIASGRLTYHVLGAVAEFERELLRERVRAGLAQARRVGKRIGRPPLRRFDASEIQHVKVLRSQGLSVRRLAIDFRTTQFTISKLLRIGSENQMVSGGPKP